MCKYAATFRMQVTTNRASSCLGGATCRPVKETKRNHGHHGFFGTPRETQATQGRPSIATQNAQFFGRSKRGLLPLPRAHEVLTLPTNSVPR